ncbi:1-hydroxycarotenoid 3,4-desaturase CrtD [Ovoidimarina sediminis]|uniref:1-hydroxycarotenoid 3,4-desaturase CrtD n=1 Tax=Ovoidimarina sediminis TaxID=3079856 RepID=UPI00290EDC2A|nr:1-hydroxycarotenoid 3,4-desaturase CrtD [Rhodophyticola sp. MJ-SS7]MDU8944524.1 FAD-dependent oxidoreductase [Rhodophyticola sp. MJ-SS7]
MLKRNETVAVIGAGVGGLAAAMRLAHAGLSVTVFERASAPGGKMRQVDSPAGPVDAGPTVLTLRPIFENLFRDVRAKLSDHVTLHEEPILARHWWPDGTTLDLFADPARTADALGHFGGVTAAREYAAFRAETARLFDAFDAPMMQSVAPSKARIAARVMAEPSLIPAIGTFETMATRLARNFSDPRLRQLFGRYATYVGGSPYAAPALLRLVAEAEARGVWRVAGGMHALARAMEKVATAGGAVFRYDTHIADLATRPDGTVRLTTAAGETHIADRCVFNGDPRALTTGHLGAAATGAVPNGAVEPRSLSANVWSFAATPTGADLVHHNVFFGHDPRTEFGPIAEGRLPEDPTLYVCAEDRGGPGPVPPLERFEIIMNAPPSNGHAEEDPSTCRTRTFPVLASRGLTFSPEPPDTALTTPGGFARLFPGSLGSLYGRSPHGTMAAFARPTARTAIPGLYLAGGGAHPGAGIPMAALSGRHAAEAILTDLASTSTSRRTAMRGGISTGSATMAPAPSRSSPS